MHAIGTLEVPDKGPSKSTEVRLEHAYTTPCGSVAFRDNTVSTPFWKLGE